MRFRNVLLIIGSFLCLLALFLTDPDKGASTGIWVVGMATGIIAVAMSHISRKGLFDYINLEEFAKRAYESPIGAGIVFMGVCMVVSSLLMVFGHR
jgi:multisubunit Na+/H+ antiporter MnhB subunit